ncbi:MAG TPA: hypothetical protein VFD13_10125 [Candidatus Kapabacteria bacterium]|nr:hypothetical protein [Candidatus Kapabacteria bacterium]
MLPKRLLALILFAALAVMPPCALRAQWVQTNGPYGGFIYCLTVNGTNLYAGTDSGIFLSTNNGDNWRSLSKPSNDGINALAVSGARLFALTGDGLFFTTDSGESWTKPSDSILKSVTPTCFCVNGTTLFMGDGSYSFNQNAGVFRSTDNGDTWTAAGAGLQNHEIHAFATIGTNLYVGTSGGICLSTDNGANWKQIDNASPYQDMTISLAVSGNELFAGTPDFGVLRSTDSGAHWTIINTGLTDSVASSLVVIGKNLFAVTHYGHGVYLSTDDGASWKAVNEGFTYTYITPLAIDGINLFAGTEFSGVWRRPLSDFGLSSVAQTPVAKSDLRSFPNPFSQSTTISFTQEASGYADISIVNLLGVEVAHLFSGEVGVGEHSFPWSKPPGLPDGMYECLVRMNGRVETLPVVLMP